MARLAVLISGSGTNLQAIIDAIQAHVIKNTVIALVISNRKDAYGLERARAANIETAYLNLIPYGKRHPSSDPAVKYGPEARAAYDADLAEKVLSVKPDMVVMAGFMHVCSIRRPTACYNNKPSRLMPDRFCRKLFLAP